MKKIKMFNIENQLPSSAKGLIPLYFLIIYVKEW